MSLSALLSLIIGFASLIIAYVFEGGHVSALIQPTAALIVFGGTIGAVGLSFPAQDLKRVTAILKVAFTNQQGDLSELIKFFKQTSIKTRKDGLLSLENDLNSSIDPFIKKGLQMVVDGVEPSTIRNILEAQVSTTFERHKSGIAIFESAGGFAPTMGIIGTVMGLVHVLGNLDSPETLGPKIAVAFIATLYGVASANLLWLPIANKLKNVNKIEAGERELMIEGIVSIQEGLNPNVLEEKLQSYLVASNKDINPEIAVNSDERVTQ